MANYGLKMDITEGFKYDKQKMHGVTAPNSKPDSNTTNH
jgi:hypothetical protein